MLVTERFSSRVRDYVKYRPGYPQAFTEWLRNEVALSAKTVVADIGAGTGLSTVPLLELGCTVYAVEPNEPMRLAMQQSLSAYPTFTAVAATAEATSLPDHSVDVVFAGQAFHWFDQEKARVEWQRILRTEQSKVILVWNIRLEDTRFLQRYKQLLIDLGTDYQRVTHENLDEAKIRAFFSRCDRVVFNNAQHFDFDGLLGRALSSSYVPQPGHPNYEPFVNGLRTLFEEEKTNEQIAFRYDTVAYCGVL